MGSVRTAPVRRGEYGYDAPYVLAGLGAAGLALAMLSAFAAWWGARRGAALALVGAVAQALGVAIFVHTTRRGKFAVWEDILTDLGLRGDERLLDLGCGRGAVLLLAARRLPRGRAVGVDLWRSVDQSGNDPEITRRNAELEGVAGRVELETADLRSLPFDDDTFDVVVSGLAIHNIHDPAGQLAAVDEAVRVLKPGGRLAIADIGATPRYAARLRELGLRDVADRPLGWRYWYGGPWVAARLVTARKPA